MDRCLSLSVIRDVREPNILVSSAETSRRRAFNDLVVKVLIGVDGRERDSRSDRVLFRGPDRVGQDDKPMRLRSTPATRATVMIDSRFRFLDLPADCRDDAWHLKGSSTKFCHATGKSNFKSLAPTRMVFTGA